MIRGKLYIFSFYAMLGIMIGENNEIAIPILGLAVFLFFTKKNLFFTICCFVVLLSYFSLYIWIDRLNETRLPSHVSSLVGEISSIPVIDGNQFSFRLTLPTKETVQINYKLQKNQEQIQLQNIKIGMICRVEGKLVQPSPARNEGGFNYQSYLYYQKIHWLFYLNHFSAAACRDQSLNMIEQLKRYRQNSLKRVEKLYPSESAGIVSALLFGSRDLLEEEIKFSYQSLGLVHVLVVSGLHVGLIVSFLYFFFIRIGITKEHTASFLILIIPVYIIITGGAPSVLRAGIMAITVLIVVRFRLLWNSLDGISAAWLLLLAVNPYYLFHIGFQLSFLISFSLLVSAKTVMNHYHHVFTRFICISLLAQIISFPLIVTYFYQFSLWSLLVNVLFVPLISYLVLPCSFLSYMLLLVFPQASSIIISFLEATIHFIHRTLQFIQHLPVGHIIVGKPHPIILFFLFLSIFFMLLKWESKEKCGLLKGIVLVAIVLAVHFMTPFLNPKGKVTILDVGQGDSILIELPFRKGVYLIDSGGIVSFNENEEWQERRNTFEVGKDIVVQTLKAKGIRYIDRFILTHGDYDHIGGAQAIINELTIGQILYPKGQINGKEEGNLLAAAQEHGIPVLFVMEGVHWSEGSSTFHILNPVGNESEKNDRSIVLYAELNNIKWLFTGDLESEGEERLIEQYPSLAVDVLKVGHHGSDTSTSEQFLTRISPKVAVISAGRNNRFGHPHQHVIKRLTDKEITILRTDQMGAIRYTYTKDNQSFTWMIQ
jgi:competence protein ComEC